MYYIKINENSYPIEKVSGLFVDKDWSNRSSKTILLKMNYNEAKEIFKSGINWSILEEREKPVFQRVNGELVQTSTEILKQEYDNSDYCILGDIIIHPTGYISVKFGKLTELEEAYEMLLGGN